LFVCELGYGLPIEPRLLGHFGIALELGEAAGADRQVIGATFRRVLARQLSFVTA
jgi:hypothetical protein